MIPVRWQMGSYPLVLPYINLVKFDTLWDPFEREKHLSVEVATSHVTCDTLCII